MADTVNVNPNRETRAYMGRRGWRYDYRLSLWVRRWPVRCVALQKD